MRLTLSTSLVPLIWGSVQSSALWSVYLRPTFGVRIQTRIPSRVRSRFRCMRRIADLIRGAMRHYRYRFLAKWATRRLARTLCFRVRFPLERVPR